MTEPVATILYLSSFKRFMVEAPSETSPSVSLDPPSVITLGSTSVDPLSSCSFVTPRDDVHVNLSSHDDESGSFTVSCGLSSSSQPIFYCDDDIMEAFSTTDFIFPAHKRNGTIRDYGDFHDLNTSCPQGNSHTPPTHWYAGGIDPTQSTPSRSVCLISTLHSGCQHCSSSSHFLSCGTF